MMKSKSIGSFVFNIRVRTILYNTLTESNNFRIIFLFIFLPFYYISIITARKEQRIHKLIQQSIVIRKFGNSRTCNANAFIDIANADC